MHNFYIWAVCHRTATHFSYFNLCDTEQIQVWNLVKYNFFPSPCHITGNNVCSDSIHTCPKFCVVCQNWLLSGEVTSPPEQGGNPDCSVPLNLSSTEADPSSIYATTSIAQKRFLWYTSDCHWVVQKRQNYGEEFPHKRPRKKRGGWNDTNKTDLCEVGCDNSGLD